MMLDPHDRKPRPYSRINPMTGRHEWVTPEEHAAGPSKRTHLETDDEVKARIRLFGSGRWATVRNTKGTELDSWLKYWDMQPRMWVDE